MLAFVVVQNKMTPVGVHDTNTLYIGTSEGVYGFVVHHQAWTFVTPYATNNVRGDVTNVVPVAKMVRGRAQSVFQPEDDAHNQIYSKLLQDTLQSEYKQEILKFCPAMIHRV